MALFPLQIIRPKVDDPNRLQQLNGVDPKLYTSADEFNIILQALDYLYEQLGTYLNTIGITNLKPELKAKVDLTANATTVDWSQGVLFVLPEMTEDWSPQFINVPKDVSKRIMIMVKGEHAINPSTTVGLDDGTTITAVIQLADVNLDGTKWNILQFENYFTTEINAIKGLNYDIE